MIVRVVEQWNHDTEGWWNSGPVTVESGGTVEQWNSDRKGWWNSGTVIVQGGGTVEQ